MSSIRSDPAAALLAEAVVREASRSTADRRMVVGYVAGISPAAVFAALMERASGTVEFPSLPEAGAMATVPAGRAALIPYLVVEPADAGRNSGSRGFAARLRSTFGSQPGGEVMVLLVMDSSPVETVLSAAEALARMPGLSWPNLCRIAAEAASGTSAQSLVEAVARDIGREPDPTGAILVALADLAAGAGADPAQTGRDLHLLGRYLSDPGASAAPEARLKRGRAWRSKLERLSMPGQRMAETLARDRVSSDTIARIIESVGPAGIDYGRFTLADMDEAAGGSRPPAFQRPLSAAGPAAQLSFGSTLVAWVDPSTTEISLALASPAGPGDRADGAWAGSAGRGSSLSGGELTVRLRLPRARTEWTFGRIELRRGRIVADAVEVAVFTSSSGSWFPVEAAGQIALPLRAFRVEAEARILAVARGGGVLGTADVTFPEERAGVRISATATRDGQSRTIPLALLGEPVDDPSESGSRDGDAGPEVPGDPGDGAGEGQPGGDGPGGDPNPGEPGAEPALPAAGYRRASPLHAVLARAARGEAVSGATFTFHTDGDDGYITVGAALDELDPQRVGGLSGLALERAILARPDAWSYVAEGTAGRVRVTQNMALDLLSLSSLPEAAVRRFSDARRSFFEALQPAGSVYAVACGQATAEAQEYVESYADLVDTVRVPGRYQAEYDRLVLTDLVLDAESGEAYLAPTNPATVAFYLGLERAAREWIDGGQAAAVLRELPSITPRYLLPLATIDGEWHEPAEAAGPFLWRRFRPMSRSGAVPGDDGTVIANRLDFFLRVFPAYRDKRQVLRITIHEPGEARAVVAALRRFYAAELTPQQADDYSKPRLDLQIISADGVLPPALEELFAGEEGRPVDRLIRSRVQVSSAIQPTAFSHISFTYSTPSGRIPHEIALDARATSMFAGGLATAAGRFVQASPNERLFAWGVFVGFGGSGGAAHKPLGRIVRRSLELVGGQPRDLMSPGITRMPASTLGLAFMQTLYRESAWVVHLDRQLGLEAFAPGSGVPTRYIVDYSELAERGRPAFEGITATEQLEPYRDAIQHALSSLGRLEEAGLESILGLLNAVSGRWAIEVLRRTPNEVRERIGTLAAVTILRDLDRAFDPPGATGVILPLDELFDAFPELRPQHRRSDSADDLLYLLVGNDGGLARIRARIIEVKYRSSGWPDYGSARQQILNTYEPLSRVFGDRGGRRLFRARDLAEAIRAAASRSASFGLASNIDHDALERSLDLIARGEFDLAATFRAAGQDLRGDVISIELESGAAPVRSLLPGEGPACGLIRAGRPVLERLAGGLPLDIPSGWTAPEQDGGGRDDGGERRPPAPDGQGGPDRGAAGTAERPRSRPQEPQIPAPVADAHGVQLEQDVRAMAAQLDAAVLKYGLDLEPFSPALAQIGPSVIRFRSRPLGRQSLDGVARRSEDLGREVGVPEGVLVAQEPFYITIDVPRRERAIVRFSDYEHLLEEPAEPGALRFLLGIAPSGDVAVEDLARLPHLLVAGATGSGKSVFLRCILLSLLKRSPEELSILLIDPKQVDFLPFEDIPHLVGNRIVFDPAEAVAILSETIGAELERRRPILKRAGVTSALEFYEAGGSLRELPQMVVVVDEFADLAATLGRQDRAAFMSIIQRYGQLTRAFGIYLVLATQRPSVQVVTGDIKANLTARVAMKVQSFQDSMTILGRAGAETLRDKGDLIFDHGGRSERLQGFMAYPADVAKAVQHWRRS